MAELKVYSIQGVVEELQNQSFDLEVKLQRLIEANMKRFFAVDFLESEYSFSSGRIDSLGIDENNCPVIFEYKRNVNENVINQGLFYLEWLLDHKADFELLVLKKFGIERAESIEWKTPIVYCVANRFTKYDVNAVKQMQRNIFLVEYKLFDDEILVFDYLNLDLKVKALPVDTKDGSKNNHKKQRDINDRMETLSSHLKPILANLRSYIASIGDDVAEVVLKQYIAYKKVSNFVTLDLTNEKIQIYLNLNPENIMIENNMRDMRNINHFGTGNVELIIKTEEDYYQAKTLIQLAYDEN